MRRICQVLPQNGFSRTHSRQYLEQMFSKSRIHAVDYPLKILFYESSLSAYKYLENRLTNIKSRNTRPTDEIVTHLQKTRKKSLVNKLEFIVGHNPGGSQSIPWSLRRKGWLAKALPYGRRKILASITHRVYLYNAIELLEKFGVIRAPY